MKSSASVTKPLRGRSRVEIPGQARREERLGRSKLIQMPNFSCTQFKVSASAHEKIGV